MAGTQPRIVLKHRPWRTTEVEAGPVPVFVKRFHDARFPGPAIGRWRDLRRARREARRLEELARAGIRVPSVIGIVETEEGVELRLGLVDGARTLDDVLDGADATLASTLGALLARLHAAGYAHGDLHLGNVLVDRAGDAWLVDAAAIRCASTSMRARDLVRAAAVARERVSAQFRARFLLAYARSSPSAHRGETSALAEAIEGAARIARRAYVRAESDRWLRESGVCARHVDGEVTVLAPHSVSRDEALAAARRALDGGDGERPDRARPEDEERDGERADGARAPRVVRGSDARARWLELARLHEHRVPAARPRVLVERPRAIAVFDEPAGAREPRRDWIADQHALGTLAGTLWDRGLALEHLDVRVDALGNAFVSVAAGLAPARTLARALRPWRGAGARADWTTSEHSVASFVGAQRGSRVQREALRALITRECSA